MGKAPRKFSRYVKSHGHGRHLLTCEQGSARAPQNAPEQNDRSEGLRRRKVEDLNAARKAEEDKLDTARKAEEDKLKAARKAEEQLDAARKRKLRVDESIRKAEREHKRKRNSGLY